MRLIPTRVPLPETDITVTLPVPGADVRTEPCTAAPAHFLPSTGIHRILVCRPTHSLGNTLLLTPLICELEKTWPGAEIDIVTRTPVASGIFGSFAQVRNVLALPAQAFRHPLKFLGVLGTMMQTRYDLVVDPYPRSGTGRALLALAKGTYKLGFGGSARDRLLTHRVAIPDLTAHTGHRPVYLLRAALGRALPPVFPPLAIELAPAERAQGRLALSRLLASTDNQAIEGTVGIFANATGPKLLPAAWWRKFLEAFAARHPSCHFVEIVPAFGRSMLDSRYPTYYSNDIRRLAGVLSQLTLFVSTDCGVMHLACASGTPVAGIFTVTDPQEWGPYGPHDRVVDARGASPRFAAEQIDVLTREQR
jgi:heptosyltransferase III